jgi:hypothetical protein
MYALILMCLIQLIRGECDYGMTSMINSPWDSYLGEIRDQSNTRICWAFSTVTYLETMYNILTRNRYRLSPEQLSDNIPMYVADDPQCRMSRPAFTGGNHYCALSYVKQRGIMTEYDYPFAMGGEKLGSTIGVISPQLE